MDPLTASELQDSHDTQEWTPATPPENDLFSHVRCRDTIFDGYGDERSGGPFSDPPEYP